MNTEDLLKELYKCSLNDYLSRDVSMPPFLSYIAQLCQERGETREHVIKRAGINRTYGHQLFNGTRKPSRDKVIQLALGFKLDIEQTQQFLKAAQESPLTPKVKRDAAILYCLFHQIDFCETQKLLLSFDMEKLGG